MTIAIWIIAVCEIIRAAQNMLQIYMLKHDTGARDDAYKAFIDSLKASDKEMVEKCLRAFQEEVEE